MQESNRKTEVEEELEDLKNELENFQQEKDRVRAVIGQIGGVPKFHNMLFNWILIIATGICLVISLLVDHLSVRLLMIELASAAISVKIIYLMELLPRRSYTLTVDNGKEFASHESVAETLRIKVYFADPYSAWQRGLNENTNGLIRQYVPKGSDVRVLTDEQIQHIMDRLNNRPRKSLGYLTPNEVFYERKKLTG